MKNTQCHKLLRLLLVLLLACTPFISFATFTLSGTTITQTGTDSDLSGLSGISGVTVEITGTGEKQVITYKVSGRRLQINGDLSHDPDKEIIIYDTNAIDITHRIGNGGIYRYGVKTTVNGVDRFSKGVGLIFTRTTAGANAFYSSSKSNIFVEDGGTFIGRGGVIFTSATQQFGVASNVTVDIENTQFFLRHTGTGTDAERDIRFDILSNTSRFKNVVFDATEGVIQYLGINANALPPTFEVILKNATIGQFGGTNTDFTLQNLDTSENIADADIAFDELNGADGFDIINSAIGSGVNALPRASTSSTRAKGWARVFRRTQFTVQDLAGAAIVGAKIYAVDNDNGNRKNGNGIDETADRTYNLTTDSNGETPETDILLAVTNRLVNGTQGAFDTGDNRIDRRTKNDQQGVRNQPDELDFYFASYNHVLNAGTFDFGGLNTLEITRVLFEDTNISETDKATVDAYTSIDNLDQLYDRAKSWKVDHVNMEVPTIGGLLITGSVDHYLDLGDYNLVVEAAAASVFAVNTGTKTITINSATMLAGNRFTSITTTGTVSTANGATLEYGYIDNTGTNKYVQLNGLTNYDVEVIDNSDPNNQIIITSSSNFTGDYKDHFILGTATEVLVRLITGSGHIFYSEIYPQDDLSFIRSNFPVSASEENQEKALYLALKILQKEETINQTLEGTTATVTIANTIVNSDADATDENQIAIIQLLERILSKISANRNSFD